jgi:hypothetical protein
VAVETLFVLEAAGFEVRAKVDFAEILEDGAVVLVRDYKSSRAMPSFEDVSRKRPDGTLMAKNFQLVLYALAVAFGVPVREEICPTCVGAGCETCRRGVVEIPEPFRVADRAQRFDLEFVYPGIPFEDGTIGRRQVSLTRLELVEYRASLEGLLQRVGLSEESGDWPAVVSDDGCAECPAKQLCPIPAELRDHRGTINTVAEAAEALEKLDREAAIHAAIRKEIKAFAKAHGVSIRFGADKVGEIAPPSQSERIDDKDGMFAAMDRAMRFGEPFDRGEFVRVVRSANTFRARTLTEEELAAEAVGETEGEAA